MDEREGVEEPTHSPIPCYLGGVIPSPIVCYSAHPSFKAEGRPCPFFRWEYATSDLGPAQFTKPERNTGSNYGGRGLAALSPAPRYC